jgi:hypothetical protein
MLRYQGLPFAFLVAALCSVPLGCGPDDGIAKRYPVSGTVTYKGEPLKKGTINFVPEKQEDRAGGGVIEDGQIKNVGTVAPGDGLLPGKYKVSITAAGDIDYAGVTKKYTSAPDPVTISKAQAKAASLIPTKYANAIDSGLTADVSSSNRTFKFELQ